MNKKEAWKWLESLEEDEEGFIDFDSKLTKAKLERLYDLTITSENSFTFLMKRHGMHCQTGCGIAEIVKYFADTLDNSLYSENIGLVRMQNRPIDIFFTETEEELETDYYRGWF